MDRANSSNMAVIERLAQESGVIRLEEADSLALRDLMRRLDDAKADAQLAADRARVAIGEATVAQQRMLRRLADQYGFSFASDYTHDAAAHTLTRQTTESAQ